MKKLFPLGLLAAPLLSFSASAQSQVHVAADGTADGPGTLGEPTTFESALKRLSTELTAKGLPDGGATIWVHGGDYPFGAGFTLGPEFAGTEGSPIVIQAFEDEPVLFDGGVSISALGFEAVTDPQELGRLAAGSADKILAKTLEDPATIHRLSSELLMTLTFDEQPCLPSVFPNDGYANLSDKAVVLEASPPGIEAGKEAYRVRAGHPPYLEEGKPVGWLGSLDEPRGAHTGFDRRQDEMAGTWEQWEAELKRNNRRNQITGFLDANWLLRSQPLVSASAETKSVQLSNVLAYGWMWKQRDKPSKVYGLLCELDAPGEWHFDTLTNRLYIYPPKPLTSETSLRIPLAAGFLHLEDTQHVSVIGIDVVNVGSGEIFQISGGSNNLIASSKIGASTARGALIGGTSNRVVGCDFVDLATHVKLGGGKRGPGLLELGRNVVENCHFYQRGFQHLKVGIAVNGAGNTFRNNLIHNSLGQALTVHGNDHLLERNELFNIGYEEGDGGAMYSGADLVGYGTEYRHNFFHHLMHVPGKVERSGIHLDDLQAGSTCTGNVFYKSAAKGIFMNGGAGHTLVDNVFLEGYRGIYNVAAGAQTNHNIQVAALGDPDHKYHNTKENYVGRAERSIGVKGWSQEPWASRYPLMRSVMEDAGQFGRMWPIRCTVKDNYYYGNSRGDKTIWSRFEPEARAKSTIEGDRLVTPEDFVDYDGMDLRFVESESQRPSIPFAEIGLYLDEYRTEMPDKDHYRKTVRAFFEGIASMPGTTKRIDTARVVDEGPVVR